MDSIKRWENSDLFKMPTMPDLLRLVTSSGYKSGWFIKQVCQKQPNNLPGLSRVENWHNPAALNPLNFSSCHWLNLHESSFTATLLGWHWWWHWWHVTASGAEPLLGLSYLPLACWEPPLSLIRPNTARSGHSLKSVQHHISGETTPLCRQIPQTSFRSYLIGWGIVRSDFRTMLK